MTSLDRPTEGNAKKTEHPASKGTQRADTATAPKANQTLLVADEHELEAVRSPQLPVK